jgi:phosphoglucomutase
MTEARQRAESWLNGAYDEESKAQIQSWIDSDSPELEDAFYKDLEFGTGGMRGIMGVGTNRVNRYTLGAATQGLSNYMQESFPGEELKVAIAYDCRNNSKELSQLVAEVFTANGIRVFLFEDLRPTPELSFAVRHLDCHAGVVLTASHNPPEYNGYKVYWEDGAQIVAPHDKRIIERVQQISDLSEIKFESNPELILEIGREEDEAFWSSVLEYKNDNPANANLKVVFTSIHGTSIMSVPEVLKRAGFQQTSVVEEQARPDGNFPTVKSPNPEEAAALAMALDLAEKEQADLVIGTDPDADRIGIAVRDGKGETVLLNGNQTGALMTEYLLQAEENKSLKDFIAYTIVSSDIFKDIAEYHGVSWEVCLTGFKHIAKLIRDNEGKKRFIGGGEESYGYMVGDFVRDKDSVTSALVVCQMAAEAKAEGKSVIDLLGELYLKHGMYREDLISVVRKGKTGAEEIAQMMQDYRSSPPKSLGGEKVVSVADYQSLEHRSIDGELLDEIDLPKSNVLQFFTESGSKISVRPSGTEPKIKFYFSARKELQDPSDYELVWSSLGRQIEAYQEDLGF